MAELAVAVLQTCDYILQLQNHHRYSPGPIPSGRPSIYGISVMCAWAVGRCAVDLRKGHVSAGHVPYSGIWVDMGSASGWESVLKKADPNQNTKGNFIHCQLASTSSKKWESRATCSPGLLLCLPFMLWSMQKYVTSICSLYSLNLLCISNGEWRIVSQANSREDKSKTTQF